MPRPEAADEADAELAAAETQTLLDAAHLHGIGRVEERRIGTVRLHVDREALWRELAHPVRDLLGDGDRATAGREARGECDARLGDAIEVAMARGLLVERRVDLIEVRHPRLGGREGAIGGEQRQPLDHEVGLHLREMPVELAERARLTDRAHVEPKPDERGVRLGRPGRGDDRGDLMPGAQQGRGHGAQMDGLGAHAAECDIEVGVQKDDPHW